MFQIKYFNVDLKFSYYLGSLYRMYQEEKSIFLVFINLSKEMYIYPIPNSLRDRNISLYSSKYVNKKEILNAVSNTGI
jgi:hypothetical protein